MSGFRTFYQEEVVSILQQRFNYPNVMKIPKLDKINLNVGLGEAMQNPKLLEDAVEELTQISGQRAVITRARKSVANFKVRAGVPIGCRVTLRRDRMYEFFNRLVNAVLPN